jgi:hypothetical protein
MTAPGNGDVVTTDSMEIRWDPGSRVALIRYAPDANLTAADGEVLVGALTGWIGANGEPFGVLADGAGLRATSAAYRATMSRFFRQHRDKARIALINVGPVIQIVAEMFRVGTGVKLKTFASDAAARSWLGTTGIAA